MFTLAMGRFFVATRMNPAPRKPAAVACNETLATPTEFTTGTGLPTGKGVPTPTGIPGGVGGGGGGSVTGGVVPAEVSTSSVATGKDWMIVSFAMVVFPA